jgi:2'-5' RNA ligase
MICGSNGAGQRFTAFALVTYIPDPLAGLLDEVRRDLVPACSPRAHVTILPPRPVAADPKQAAGRARSILDEFAPFEVEASDVKVFPVTGVVYVEVGQGAEQLRQLHAALNTGPLEFDEPFEYHPHITLAQDLQPQDVEQVAGRARRAWAGLRPPRRFLVETATFVQNTLPNVWLDLETFTLKAVPLAY